MDRTSNSAMQVETFVSTLTLGNTIVPAQRLDGGLLHENWKIVTSDAEFVVKKLNPVIMTKDGAVRKYEESETVATLFQTHSSLFILIICPLECLFHLLHIRQGH